MSSPSTRSIDIQRDHKVRIQGCAIVLALVAVAGAVFLGPLIASGWHPGVVLTVTLAAGLGYLMLHEATHGVAARLLTGQPSSYSLRFPFLRTGNQGVLSRNGLVTVALAPALLWGVLLAVALFTVPGDLRMTCYILLAINIAGSAGDYIEAAIALRQPGNALFRDDGAELEVHLPE